MNKNLILIPPFMSTKSFWDNQVEALEGQANIFVPDTTKHDNIEDIASEIISHVPAEFYLAGLSMGGYVCFEIMRQLIASGDDGRIKKLALLGTNFRADTPIIIKSREDQMAAALDGDMEGVYSKIIPLLVHKRFHKDIDFLTQLYGMVIELGSEVFVRQQLVNMSRVDSTSLLPNIKRQTLLICGRDDVLTPVPYHNLMQEFIPRSDLVLIDDCGHFSPLEQPDQVSSSLKQWLND
jgi:pimeloyl-ACP methyl ester carboxylesterase